MDDMFLPAVLGDSGSLAERLAYDLERIDGISDVECIVPPEFPVYFYLSTQRGKLFRGKAFYRFEYESIVFRIPFYRFNHQVNQNNLSFLECIEQFRLRALGTVHIRNGLIYWSTNLYIHSSGDEPYSLEELRARLVMGRRSIEELLHEIRNCSDGVSIRLLPPRD